MTKKKKKNEERGRGSYRSFASPFIRWSLWLLWDGRKRGGNGRVEPTGVRIDRRASFASRDPFTSIVVVFREKLLRLVKLCSLNIQIFFVFISIFTRVPSLKFSSRKALSRRGEYHLVVSI